jgi:hypothetical protein
MLLICRWNGIVFDGPCRRPLKQQLVVDLLQHYHIDEDSVYPLLNPSWIQGVRCVEPLANDFLEESTRVLQFSGI